MKNQLISIILCLFICLTLCSCSFGFDVTEMLKPPRLEGDSGEVAEALKHSVGGGISLRYPHSGENRSAVILSDIDGNGEREALAFYSKSNQEKSDIMHIALLTLEKKDWVIASDIEVKASAVSRVDFCDFSGNGINEIVVGWDIYADSTKHITVFKLDSGVLVQRNDEPCIVYTTCDLNDDGRTEIFLVNRNAAEKRAYASLLSVEEKEIKELSQTLLDSSVKEYISLTVSSTAEGKTAIYLDGLKAGSATITELIFVDNGRLKNPFYNQETGTNSMTARPFEIKSCDINGDGVPEIPYSQALPLISGDGTNKDTWLTTWKTYGAEGLADTAVSIVNVTNEYMFLLPEGWGSGIGVVRAAEQALCTVYQYNLETAEAGAEALSIKIIPNSEWEALKAGSAYTEIESREGQSYLVHLPNGGIYKSAKDAKAAFRLIQNGDIISLQNSKEANGNEKDTNS